MLIQTQVTRVVASKAAVNGTSFTSVEVARNSSSEFIVYIHYFYWLIGE